MLLFLRIFWYFIINFNLNCLVLRIAMKYYDMHILYKWEITYHSNVHQKQGLSLNKSLLITDLVHISVMLYVFYFILFILLCFVLFYFISFASPKSNTTTKGAQRKMLEFLIWNGLLMPTWRMKRNSPCKLLDIICSAVPLSKPWYCMKMHILLTVLHTFLREVVRRNCVNIKTSYPWWSLFLFSSFECLNK